MPNWCSNYIQITGSKTAIKKIKSKLGEIQNEGGVFETLVGIEPTITQEEYDKGGWYNSNVNYWGTKWDVGYDDCQFDFDETTITMMPDTAWSPPTGFCVALAKKYKVDVKMEYSEPGCDFCGKTLIDKKGESDDECYSYLEGKYYFDNESFWYEIESHIEYYVDDNENMTPEEWVNKQVSFASQEDMKEILEMIKEKKNENS